MTILYYQLVAITMERRDQIQERLCLQKLEPTNIGWMLDTIACEVCVPDSGNATLSQGMQSKMK